MEDLGCGRCGKLGEELVVFGGGGTTAFPEVAFLRVDEDDVGIAAPAGVEGHDFRDPYVFQHTGHWYMVLGASLDHQRGQCLLYRSADGNSWEYCGVLYAAEDSRLGVMWECPNFFPLGDDGKWVLTVSLWLGLGVQAWVGRFENERFVPEAEQVIDVDAGAFAPLTMRAPDGRTLAMASTTGSRQPGRTRRTTAIPRVTRSATTSASACDPSAITSTPGARKPGSTVASRRNDPTRSAVR